MHKNTLSYILFFIGTMFILAALIMMGGLELSEFIYVNKMSEVDFFVMVFSIMNSIIGVGLIITGAIIYTKEVYYSKENKNEENKNEEKEN